MSSIQRCPILFLLLLSSQVLVDAQRGRIRSRPPHPQVTPASSDIKRPISYVLYGSIFETAYWFADVYVGLPTPQRQSLIIDTGSSVTGFPCTGCKVCGSHLDLPFDLRLSNFAKPVECTRQCNVCTRDDTTELKVNNRDAFDPSGSCAYHVRYMFDFKF